MYENLKNEIVAAMKEKNMMKVQTLRGVKGNIDLEHINKKVEIDDNLVLDILTREIKTRKESIVEFEKGGRSDLVSKTNEEIKLLETYLPEQLSDSELEKIIDDVFQKVAPTSARDMGLIMKELTPLVKGKADMKEVSLKIKERLASL